MLTLCCIWKIDLGLRAGLQGSSQWNEQEFKRVEVKRYCECVFVSPKVPAGLSQTDHSSPDCAQPHTLHTHLSLSLSPSVISTPCTHLSLSLPLSSLSHFPLLKMVSAVTTQISSSGTKCFPKNAGLFCVYCGVAERPEGEHPGGERRGPVWLKGFSRLVQIFRTLWNDLAHVDAVPGSHLHLELTVPMCFIAQCWPLYKTGKSHIEVSLAFLIGVHVTCLIQYLLWWLPSLFTCQLKSGKDVRTGHLIERIDIRLPAREDLVSAAVYPPLCTL